MNRSLSRPLVLVSLTAFACILSGCGDATTPVGDELKLTEEPDMAALAHQPSEQIDEVFREVEEVLDKVYAQEMPERFPNWIAFHAHLMYGDSAYAQFLKETNADENLKRIYAILLHSDTAKLGPYVLRSGLPYPRKSGPYFMQEHHPDQFLTYFSMGGGSLDAKIEIDEKTYTFRNLLDRSLLEARPSGELAYSVLAYSHYLEPGKRWSNKFDEPVSFAILVERLLETPEPTCLGTHRIAALARTLSHEHLRTDEDLERLWPELRRQVSAALLFLKQSQGPDGAFAPPGTTSGTQTRDHQDVYYTGHCLEWIMFLDGQYLRDDWVVRAIQRLTEVVDATHVTTYRNMGACLGCDDSASHSPGCCSVGSHEAHFDFDGLSHAASALRRWHNRVGNSDSQ
jgi:hypothetical protein